MATLRVLGSVEILDSDEVTGARRAVSPTPPKVRQVLAFLTLRTNHVVPAETLIAELWDEAPPRSAVTTVQTYIYHLRKFLAAQGIEGLGADRVKTRLPGYALELDPGTVDVTRFRAHVREARELLGLGGYEAAFAASQAALDLWHGPALANVPRLRLLEAYATHLEEERLSALELQCDIAFALGRHREQIPSLRSLVAMHPLNEGFHGRLIEALGRADRRGEALVAYHAYRRVLHDELGLDPSPRVQQLQYGVLNAP